MAAGAVNVISSEEEFDLVLRGHQQRLVVLEASLTWCRPCKGFDRAYQKFAEHYLNTGAQQPSLAWVSGVLWQLLRPLLQCSDRAHHAASACLLEPYTQL